MIRKTFLIGNFPFEMTYPDDLVPPDNFLLFEKKIKSPEWKFNLIRSDSFPEPSGELIAKRGDLEVYKTDLGEMRYIGVDGTPGFYACLVEGSESTTTYLDFSSHEFLNVDPVFTSLLALERHISDRNDLILHCAYLEYNNQSILFSGPSGTGKSTQADLWLKHRDCSLINGDKSLLVKMDGKWFSCGWPVCGSSNVCNNIDTPIRAIVLLRQGESNTIKQLKGMQAFTGVYPQLTLNRWNQEALNRAMDSLENLISNVPVYQLTCTISEEAVDVLEAALS